MIIHPTSHLISISFLPKKRNLFQKPLMLHGHERAITKIKYNREGDLLFSASKDKQPNVWYSLNGERLGTFNGHNGSVWCIDVNWDTTRLLSGSGDNTLRVWDCETGLCI